MAPHAAARGQRSGRDRARQRGGPDLAQPVARAAATTGPESPFVKTKMCAFYTVGACQRGGFCHFAHSEADLNPNSFYRTRLCKFAILNGKCNSPNCSYAHSNEELRDTASISSSSATYLPPPPQPSPQPHMQPVMAPRAQFTVPLAQLITEAAGIQAPRERPSFATIQNKSKENAANVKENSQLRSALREFERLPAPEMEVALRQFLQRVPAHIMPTMLFRVLDSLGHVPNDSTSWLQQEEQQQQQQQQSQSRSGTIDSIQSAGIKQRQASPRTRSVSWTLPSTPSDQATASGIDDGDKETLPDTSSEDDQPFDIVIKTKNTFVHVSCSQPVEARRRASTVDARFRS